ncbi:MAG: polyphosphate kinase [Saprospiraceae bacterium]|nr:polyphosphate kinase [Saprospiraceae bacterium]
MAKQPTVILSEISTEAPKGIKKDDLKAETEKLVKRLGELHHLMYAEGKHSVLVIFQGMDASGTDGAVRNVFRDCTIAGLDLVSFKKPTEEEFAHDFLWRVHRWVPQKGMLTIFNRSHYEDILIQRVHNWIDMERVKKRMAAINALEELLEFDNNTVIFKFYMHISKEEQEEQLQQRLDDPTKFWKHNDGDWEERKHWDAYMEAYEYAINASSVPWHICPVDNRWYRDYFIAKTMVEALEKLNMQLPVPEKK